MMLKGYNPAALNFPTSHQRRLKKSGSPVPTRQSPRVTINVSGMRYETYEETLLSFPDTLLGSPTKRSKYYDSALDEFVFARDKPSFDAILFFYQSRGILAKPDDVSEETFLQEIEFYEIGQRYHSESLPAVPGSHGEVEVILPYHPLKRKLWLWLEFPASSAAACALALWATFVIVFSTIIFCVETLPALEIKSYLTYRNVSESDRYKLVSNEVPAFDYWFVMEGICVSWFTIEYFMRLYSAPSTWNFAKSAMGLIDALAILPFYITLALRQSTEEVTSFSVLRVVRLFRVLRVFKLSRYSAAMKLLMSTLYCSCDQLKTLGFCFCVSVVLFSSALFYAEEGRTVISIPDAFWWTIITMTSVGYGDITPSTTLGKCVGCFCAMSGVALFCLPTPVLVTNFIKFYLNYGHADAKQKAFAQNLREIFLKPKQR